MKQDAQKIASVMAGDFHSPAGAIPFERLLRKHHRLLVELRESGLTWEQVSRLLAGSGVKRSDGLPFPASHLRGVFGRHRKRAPKVSLERPAGNIATLSTAAASLNNAVEAGDEMVEFHKTVDGMSGHGMSEASPRTSFQSVAIGGTQRSPSCPQNRAQILAVMRQSVRARHERN